MSQRNLLKHARLTRKQLIGFALLSAVINGLITASVGAWLGQTYAKYQARRQSIESLVHLVYERRTRAGMVTSALKRGADIDEIRYRKRAYDKFVRRLEQERHAEHLRHPRSDGRASDLGA